jgi:ketosteroid isomerase-like protein
MSEENVEVVRAMNEAFLRRDWETANSLLADDIEWDATRIAGIVPDLAGVYRGAGGTAKFWGAWLSPWEKVEMEYELRDAGAEVVSLIRNQRQWGRHSGVETKIPPYAWVFTIRDGKAVRGCWHPDHQSALASVGLSE